MATYKVQTGETISKVAGKLKIPEQALKTANKGVSTLSTGQIIKVPTGGMLSPEKNSVLKIQPKLLPYQNGTPLPNTPANVHTQVPVMGAQNPTGSFMSGSGAVNVPRPVQTGGMLSPEKNATGAAQNKFGIMNQSSMYSPTQAALGVVNEISAGRVPTSITPAVFNQYDAATQQQLAQLYIKNPTTGQYEARADVATANGGMPPRPDGVYTGDPSDPNTQRWKDYWNSQAAGKPLYGYQGGSSNVRRSGGGGGGGSSGGGQSYQYNTGQNAANNSYGGTRVITWRT